MTRFERIADFILRVQFSDDVIRVIDFQPVLRGEIYGPLADLEFFSRVLLDQEAGTLVWPNGADFDPAILHDWPEREAALIAMTSSWPEPAIR
ncbi:MAG TPA: DUF2442 domain-containing protein [Thermoanaerobaculia bacterium]|nr:DUF2442 domain-containing protein [Thermoanaerobaculia bacterium]